jgi:hypothetical protein
MPWNGHGAQESSFRSACNARTTIMYQVTKIATALTLAGALTTAATISSRGDTLSVHVGKRPADANGYFFYPGNSYDDGYVYDPAASRGELRSPMRRSRHRHRAS